MEQFIQELGELKNFVNSQLSAHFQEHGSVLQGLNDSMKYSLFSNGKRLRPIFCLLVGDVFEVNKEKLISTACALEMIHTSSLILDDLPYMDNANIRRGKSANHVIYGHDTAILASVALLMKALKIIASDSLLAEDIKNELLMNFTCVVGTEGMTGGQFADLRNKNAQFTEENLDYIHTHKTASLFILAGLSAAIIANASLDEKNAIKNYALNLGFAFQVLDDILDTIGKEDETGKSGKRDKINFVKIYGSEKSAKLVDEYTQKAQVAIEIFKGRNSKLNQLAKILLNRRS
jgi:geranylgeranyl diphosphate synthase type II